MNLLVTGGTGFFGKALIRYWKNNYPSFCKIYILSRSPESFLNNYSDLIDGLPLEFIKGDILNLSDINFDKVFDVVLHAATDSTKGPSLNRLDVYTQITKGTEEVLKLAIRHGCKKFVITSSGAVYGSQPSHLDKIPETYLGSPEPLNIGSTYGIGKKAAEHLCALYASKYKFDYVVTRCFSFVGEDLPLNKHFAIGNFILNALNGEDIVVRGSGSAVRSYLYQDDLAMILTKVLLGKTQHTVYNVGSDKEVSIKSLAYLVRDIISPGSKVVIQNLEDGNYKNRYVPDISRVKKIIGRHIYVDLQESIKLTQSKVR